MPKSFFFLFLLLLLSSFFIGARIVRGDELDDINKQINDLTNALSQSKAATAPLESQVSGIKSRVAFIEGDLVRKKKDIDKGYKDLEKQKELLDEKIVNYYINSYRNCTFCFLLGSSIKDFINNLAYQQALIERDKEELIKFALTIADLESKKASLKDEEKRLAVIKENLDKIIGEAKTYQGVLSGKIAELSAKQQSILSQRLASLNIPRSAGTSARGCTDDREVDPGFSPRLAFFTYGAPHRVGMNQYGAKGRADAGQGRDDILKAYYANFEVTKWDTNIKIKVQGQGEFLLEDYTLRIYEMPESWPMAALEAQVIAARSFALAYTNNGAGEICTSESCQVFQPNPKTGNWAQAVKNTEGLVMTSGGSPIKAWYASTHGGYVFTSAEVWGGGTPYTKHATDTTTGSAGSFSELQSNAYDKESPWFYCDWGSRPEYNKTAWLKSEEVADIANVILLARKDSGTGKHLYQVDKPNPEGTDTWDANRVRQELGTGALSSVSDISVSVDFGSGKTTGVSVNGQSFSADEFKNWFNLRAPANIQIVGPLFNVEKK